ncbi:MAG: diphthamide biosynthesis enzyme Dph2 [Candidatus Nezhaarchaeota archaeon]|nr:diphthamide biosynthesis enzyme Dph2 [Candidatus Nezhaarchaeota archaeon]
MFNFRLVDVVNEIRRKGAKRVALQLPEGLKPYASYLADVIQRETGCTPILLGDPCYGACDIAWDEAARLGVDLLIHFGHNEPALKEGRVDTLYVDCYAEGEATEVVKMAEHLLRNRGKRIGLCTTLQYVQMLKEAANVLESIGFEVYVARPAKPNLKPGQVIGCDYTSGKHLQSNVDCLLFIGGGVMHPLGLGLSTGLPVIAADPIAKKLLDVEPYVKKTASIKLRDITTASEAKKFGVLIGLKPGQYRPRLIEKVVRELNRAKKEVLLIACREVTPSLEANFPDVESFVVTSCPLLAFFEREGFRRPLLTPKELQLSLSGGWRYGYSDPFEGF